MSPGNAKRFSGTQPLCLFVANLLVSNKILKMIDQFLAALSGLVQNGG